MLFLLAMAPLEGKANPYFLGDDILDGDENAQVHVYLDGSITAYALRVPKWREYFQLGPLQVAISGSSEDNTSSERSLKKRKLEIPGEEEQ